MEIKTEVKTKVVRFIEYDGLRFYPDKRGYWLSQRKRTRKPVRLHVYVWEKHNGPVPPGYHIHHKDFNPDNNEIENLQLIPKEEHLKYHAGLQDKSWCRKNLIENAVPAAKAWHASPEGKAWHSKHAQETNRIVFEKKIKKICQCCGKEYEVPYIASENSRFCSNNCKSQWRRDSGIDNIEVKCEICDNRFFTNKYARKRFCSFECRAEGARRKKALKRP